MNIVHSKQDIGLYFVSNMISKQLENIIYYSTRYPVLKGSYPIKKYIDKSLEE